VEIGVQCLIQSLNWELQKMKEQLITRLQTLKQEYETGQKMLADLELKHLAADQQE
jgi:hypothetical protein